jgi:hypothetical protein
VSISSIAGGNTLSRPPSNQRTNSVSAAGSQADEAKLAPGMNADTPYDAITVNLPNSMSVGIFSSGGGGFDSAALKTFEDFVEQLASSDIPGHPASGADGASASSDADEASGVAGLEKLQVDLPNGISFEVRHSSGGQATDNDAVMKELTGTAEDLAEVLGKYSPAATAATTYAASQAGSSDRANQVDTRT